MNAKKRAKTLTKQAALKRAWSIYDRTSNPPQSKIAHLLGECYEHPEYCGLAKGSLFHLAQNSPRELRELADELYRQKRDRTKPWRDKFPRGRYMIWAYEKCASYPPTFGEVKDAFIAMFGKEKWNNGDDDDKSHGDFSARKTLKILRLPLKEMKKGRRPGSKSLLSGPQGLKKYLKEIGNRAGNPVVC